MAPCTLAADVTAMTGNEVAAAAAEPGEPGIKRRMARGAFWIAATRAFVNLAGFLSMLFLARLLAPADFGLVAIASTVSTIILAVSELSLSQALVYHRDLTDDHFHTAFSLNFLRGIVLAAVILLLAWPISRFYADERLVGAMVVIALTAVIGGALNPKLIVYSRELIFWQEFALGVSQKMVSFLVSVVVAIITQSYWALLAGMVASQLVNTALSYGLIRYRPRVRFSQTRELLSFSIWLTLGQAINTINWRFDHLVIGYFLGSTTLGYYTVGDNLAVLPTREATLPISQALFPSFAKLNGDLPRLRDAYQRAQGAFFIVGFPLGCGFGLVAEPFVQLAMGEKWHDIIIIVQLLSFIFASQTVIYALQPLGMAMGQTRELLQRDVANFVVRLPLIVIGLVSNGLLGIIWARCVGNLIAILISMAMVRKLLSLSILTQFQPLIRPACAVLAMAAGVYLVDVACGDGNGTLFLISKIAAMTASGAAIYLGALYGLWRLAGRPRSAEGDLVDLGTRFFTAITARYRFLE